jgi:serine/threonine-protein kinase
LGTKQPGWRYPSAEWIRKAEAKAEMESKLPAFLKGEFQPHNNEERLVLAGVCEVKKLNHAAVGLYAAAFADDPKLADDLKADHRYNAAFIAVLAASGQGNDAAQLDGAERTRLRRQALDWLRAQLALLSRQIESTNHAAAVKSLRHWQQDTDLAGIRSADALAKLPDAERKEWDAFWGEVADLLKRAEGRKP